MTEHRCTGEGFAIPIDKAVALANEIRSGAGTPYVHIGPSAMIGIGIDAGGRNRPDGLPVRSVLRDGPAAQVGLVPGDTLRAIDGTPIDSANTLTGLLDQAKQRLGSGVAVIVAVNEGKASIAAAVTDDLTGKVSAVDLVRAGVEALGGKGGGGRPDMAQGGGPDGDKADAAIAAAKGVLAG